MSWFKSTRKFLSFQAFGSYGISLTLVFVISYFKFPFYDRPTSKFAEANKEAFSIAEFLTIPTSGFVPTPFKGVALASFLVHCSSNGMTDCDH